MKNNDQTVRINIWAQAVQKLEELHRHCENFREEDGRFRKDSLDFFWSYLLTIWLERWCVRGYSPATGIDPILTIGYPNIELILDKRSNHIIPTRYVNHAVEPTLRELIALLSYWNETPNRDLLIGTMLDELRAAVPVNINYEV